MGCVYKYKNDWVDFSNLVYKNKNGKDIVDWAKSYGQVIPFKCENIIGNLIFKSKKDNDRIYVEYAGMEHLITINGLKKANLRVVLGLKTAQHKYGIGNIIKRKYGELQINTQIYIKSAKGKSVKGYNVTCLICGNNFNISETHINEGCGCSVCSNHVGLDGYNMIADTDFELAKLLLNPNDAHKFKAKSNQKLDWKCQCCGKPVYQRSPAQVKVNGVLCATCNRKSSYPNRLMYGILTQLNEDFSDEQEFDWCKFKAYDSDRITFGIYDFVVNNKKLIIEMDGGLGHGHKTKGLSREKSIQEAIYRDKMKDELAKQNGYRVIRIDCNYVDIKQRLNYIRQSILESELSQIYDLSNIKWDDIDSMIFVAKSGLYNDNYKLAYEYWNYGWSTVDISKKLDMDYTCVLDYLHDADRKGLLQNYNHAESRARMRTKLDDILNTDRFYNENDTFRKSRSQLKLEEICRLYREKGIKSIPKFAESIGVKYASIRQYIKIGKDLNMIGVVV